VGQRQRDQQRNHWQKYGGEVSKLAYSMIVSMTKA
jgi:hypothetical protein